MDCSTHIVFLLLFVFMGPCSFILAQEVTLEETLWSDIRLPPTISPHQYTLFLHPNLTDGQFQYTGTIKILLEVKQETDMIVLHSFKLNHLVTSLVEAQPDENEATNNGKVIPIKGTVFNEINQQAIIQLKSRLSAKKKYSLTITFSGELRTTLAGFYRSSYLTKDGETRYIASTFFAATSARMAFPCFDEPAMKARFRIHMMREKRHTALSNMPVEEEFVRPDGLIVVRFKESVKMSTYLVAFIICDFEKITGKSKRGVVVNVWAPKDQLSQAKYAIDIAPKILDHFEDFFNITFPLPKQDLIGIADFTMGAMENWGLITYRLTALLYDEKESSDANKQRVAEIIVHEMAHQWLGNLVTMNWWNDVWLNEGFATFVQSVGTAYLYPEWRMNQQFLLNNVQPAMVVDGHEKSHPIDVEVRNPAEINSLYDLISYQKGSSIIRMMEDFLGHTNMMRGLTNYLKKHKYSIADSDDLWHELGKAFERKLDVETIMDTWTKQMGYPVVTVTRDGEEALLVQERFVTDTTARFNITWNIPITFYFEKSRCYMRRWFMGKIQKDGIRIPWKRSLGWIKVNVDQVGFYRVNYDQENWNALTEQLNVFHDVFSEADRSHLIDDAFQLAKSGRLSPIQALEMTEYLEKEKDYVPFSTATRSLEFIGAMLTGDDYETYEKYIMEKIMPSVKRLGWADTGSHLDKYLRCLVLRLAAEHGCKCTVKKSKSMFKEWMKTGTEVEANFRAVVYYSGIKYGGIVEWKFMLSKYMKSLYPSERKLLMLSLSYSTNSSLLSNYLNMSLNEKYVRSQDAHLLIAKIAHNPDGHELAYQFIINNWGVLIERYRNVGKSLTKILEGVFASGKTVNDYMRAKEFLDSHDLGAAAMSKAQILGSINNHIIWLKKNEKIVVNWFKTRTPKINIDSMIALCRCN